MKIIRTLKDFKKLKVGHIVEARGNIIEITDDYNEWRGTVSTADNPYATFADLKGGIVCND